MAKVLVTGKFLYCFDLAEKWAPEAFQAATEGLSDGPSHLPPMPASCASVVAQKMGASDVEMAMAAGFAGGLGLSGNACGALGAAIWMNSLAWIRKQPEKAARTSPNAAKTLDAFLVATDHEFLCRKITGQSFKTIDDHTEFIRNGGCDKLINVLAQSQSSSTEVIQTAHA